VELFALARVLWSYRIMVIVGAVLSVVLGFFVMKGPETHFSTASARVVLDTKNSQLVDVEPTGADTLGWRAALLADLLGDKAQKADVARTMGIREADLFISAPYLSAPNVATPLPKHSLEAAHTSSEPYELALQGVPALPIVAIDARAPTPAAAAKLAAAAATALKRSATAHAGVDGTLAYTVEDMGPVKAREVVNRPRRSVGLAATLLLFGSWCFLLVLIAGTRRAIRPSRPIATQPL
jgi:hypothetical protein